MTCPFCSHKNSKTYNTRPTNEGYTIWRRHKCDTCGKKFTTTEHILLGNIIKVSSKNSTKSTTQPFDRYKLLIDIYKACDHITDAPKISEYLLSTIELNLVKLSVTSSQVVTKKDILVTSAKILKAYDFTSYVKYMSYHPGSNI